MVRPWARSPVSLEAAIVGSGLHVYSGLNLRVTASVSRSLKLNDASLVCNSSFGCVCKLCPPVNNRWLFLFVDRSVVINSGDKDLWLPVDDVKHLFPMVRPWARSPVSLEAAIVGSGLHVYSGIPVNVHRFSIPVPVKIREKEKTDRHEDRLEVNVMMHH